MVIVAWTGVSAPTVAETSYCPSARPPSVLIVKSALS